MGRELTESQQYNRRLLSRASRHLWRKAMLLRHVALAKKYFNANIAAELKRQPKYADELPLLAAPTAAPEEIAKREGEPEL